MVQRAITQPDSEPIYKPKPKFVSLGVFGFPAPPRLQGLRFDLNLTITTDGSVDTSRSTISPTPEPRDRDYAMRELTRWHFNPAVLEGCAVPGRALVHIGT